MHFSFRPSDGGVGGGGKHMTESLRDGDLGNTTFHFVHSEIISG